jgi:hypothetical protein
MSSLALDETSLSTTLTTPTVGGTQTDSSPGREQEGQSCQDILVCGVCQREFALQDILKFISHKVNSCSNKENVCRNSTYSDDDVDDNDNQMSIDDDNRPEDNINNNNDHNNSDLSNVIATNESAECAVNVRKQTPSIINSSQRHKLYKFRSNRVHSQRQNSLFNSCWRSDSSAANSETPGEKRTVADAHTNTVNTGN